MSLEALKESCFGLTASFEGRGYDQVTPNIDGMGASIGLFQWNAGTGGLQWLLRRAFQIMRPTVEMIAGSLADELEALSRMQPAHAVRFFEGLCEGSRWAPHAAPWVRLFTRLCRTPQFQSIQREAAERYWRDAVADARFFNVRTKRGVALMFDVAIQNGIHKIGKTHSDDTHRLFQAKGGFALPYRSKLIAIAESVAATSRKVQGDWIREDVLSRKLAIVCNCGRSHTTGQSVTIPRCGKVHGRIYKLEQYGITDEPVNIG